MNTNSSEAVLNSRLVECEQIYRRLEDEVVHQPVFDLGSTSPERRSVFAKELFSLLQAHGAVEQLLKEVVLDDVLQNIAPRSREFYRNELEPNWGKFERLLYEMLDFPDFDVEQGSSKSSSNINPIWNILLSGLDYWKDDESGQFSEEALKDTDRLLYSDFFNPDEWLRNADDLKPVLGNKLDKLPVNIRRRLMEVYRSFILGNYLSAIALARSILEYSLVYRSTNIGIKAFSDDEGHHKQQRRLGLLVGDAAEKKPALKEDMEAIVEAGNWALHPKKKDTILRHDTWMRHLALTSTNAVRRVVERLYLD